jgi:hypothetical protein
MCDVGTLDCRQCGKSVVGWRKRRRRHHERRGKIGEERPKGDASSMKRDLFFGDVPRHTTSAVVVAGVTRYSTVVLHCVTGRQWRKPREKKWLWGQQMRSDVFVGWRTSYSTSGAHGVTDAQTLRAGEQKCERVGVGGDVGSGSRRAVVPAAAHRYRSEVRVVGCDSYSPSPHTAKGVQSLLIQNKRGETNGC